MRSPASRWICRKMRDFLERDQLGYWQAQIKRRNEEVMQARSDLHRRKISQQGSDAVSDSEQKEALREAMRRLRIAEEKVAADQAADPAAPPRDRRVSLALAAAGRPHHRRLREVAQRAGADGPVAGGLRRHHGADRRRGWTRPPRPRAGPPRPAPPPRPRRPTAPRPSRPTAPADRGHRRRRDRDGRGISDSQRDGSGTGRRGRPAGEELIHQRPIRPAPARPEDPAREVGHRHRDLGRPRLARLREEPHHPDGADGQARHHRHGEALRSPRQAPSPV